MTGKPMARSRSGAISLLAATALLLGGAAGAPAAQADAIRPYQWYLDGMHADDMWKTSTGTGITVAVIDTGVDASHADLKGQVLPGKDFTNESGTAQDDPNGHGTGMANLIAGTGRAHVGEGGYGLAPGTHILPIRVDAGGTGANAAVDWQDGAAVFSKAIRYAADSDAQVINISMGIGVDTPQLASAVRYAVSKNKLIFAGVGNDGEKGNLVQYPAATPGVVGVAAIDKNANATSWSEHGTQVSMAAPGEDMVHGCAGNSTGYCKTSGTSDATAIASASAALIWSAHRDWTANQVLRVMLNTAGAPRDGVKRNDYIGYGVVRPRIALSTPGDPGPANVNPLFPQLNAKSSTPVTPPADAAASASHGAAKATEGSSSVGPLAWAGIGAAVLLLTVAGGAILLSRRRASRGY